jgi:hypothetical protein
VIATWADNERQERGQGRPPGVHVGRLTRRAPRLPEVTGRDLRKRPRSSRRPCGKSTGDCRQQGEAGGSLGVATGRPAAEPVTPPALLCESARPVKAKILHLQRGRGRRVAPAIQSDRPGTGLRGQHEQLPAAGNEALAVRGDAAGVITIGEFLGVVLPDPLQRDFHFDTPRLGLGASVASYEDRVGVACQAYHGGNPARLRAAAGELGTRTAAPAKGCTR